MKGLNDNLTRFVIRQNVLNEAKTWIGTPYCHQASQKKYGTDCLGLICGIWHQLYGDLPCAIPSYTMDWAETGKSETLARAACKYLHEIHLNEMRPGDILLFRWRAYHPAKHIGILDKNDQFIHAYEGNGVVVSPLKIWRRKIAHAFLFKPK